MASEVAATASNCQQTDPRDAVQNAPSKTTRDPDISMNLVNSGSIDSSAGEAFVVTDRSTGSVHEDRDDRPPQRQNEASFLGESWYASYLLSHTTSEHVNLYRPIMGHQKEAAQQRPRDSDLLRNSKKHQPDRPLPSDLPAPALLNRLIEAYFTRFHVFCPILDKAVFLSSLHDRSISHTLLRSVLFVGSIHCDPEVFHLMGYSTRSDAGDGLFCKAREAFDSDNHSDRITMLLSSFFLHYWFGQPTTFRDFLWWLATAIRSAQCMGMHRSTVDSKMQPVDRRTWRRIWWCLYVRCNLCS